MEIILLGDKKLSFNRTDVLEKLWRRAKWIEAKIDNQRTKLNPNLKVRASFVSKECRIYQTILMGLKDEALEIRLMELEEKLKNGVLIPKPEEKKR
jgi:transcription elongation GreA/GreB family factor